MHEYANVRKQTSKDSSTSISLVQWGFVGASSITCVSRWGFEHHVCLGGSEERFPDPVSIHVEQRSSSWWVGRELPFLNLHHFLGSTGIPGMQCKSSFSSVMFLAVTYDLVSIGPMHYATMHPQLVQGAVAPKRVAEKQYTHILD